MTFNPDIHHRRSIRLKDYAYSHAGAYFVTICAWQRECLFGEIVDGEMRLNDMGQAVESVWSKLSEHFSGIELDASVTMPNHFHGIINIVGAKQGLSASADSMHQNQDGAGKAFASPLPCGTEHGSLGAVIQNFKSVSTRKLNKIRNNTGCPIWQRNYYERVIRNEAELTRARDYIVNNPLKWELDKENPVNN